MSGFEPDARATFFERAEDLIKTTAANSAERALLYAILACTPDSVMEEIVRRKMNPKDRP